MCADYEMYAQISMHRSAVILSLRHCMMMLLLALGLIASSCSSQNSSSSVNAAVVVPPGEQAQATPAIRGAFLPLPSELQHEPAPARESNYLWTDLFKDGCEYESALANRNIAVNTDNPAALDFAADWTEGSESLDGLAFAMYRITVAGYDREPEVRALWSNDARPDHHQVWLGMANWDKDCWDWYTTDELGVATLPGMAHYWDSDEVLITVLLCGEQFGTLEILLLGANTTAELVAGASGGIAPFTTTYSALGSYTWFGGIDVYEWDWDNDGEFEENTGSSPSASHTYSSPGLHTATVRITNLQLGDTATDSVTVDTFAPWAHSWGTGLNESVKDITCDGDNSIYLAGTVEVYDLLVAKSDLSGNIQWARRWGGADQEVAEGVVVSAGGDIYVCGRTSSFGAGNQDVLLQRWDSAGNLQWTKTWGKAGDDRAQSISTRDDCLYVAGTTCSFGDAAGDALLVKFDSDGQALWARGLGAAGFDRYWDSTISYDWMSETMYIHVIGDTHSFGSGTLYARFCHDGTLSKTARLEGNDVSGRCLAATGLFGSILYIGGYAFNGGECVLLACVDGSAVAFAKAMYTDTASCNDLVYRSNEGITACARLAYGGSEGLLINMSTDGVLKSAQTWDVTGELGSFEAILNHPGSGYLIGGSASMSDGGAWANKALTADDLSLTWTEFSTTAQTISGTVTNAETAAVDITSGGIADSGGGGMDALLMALPPFE